MTGAPLAAVELRDEAAGLEARFIPAAGMLCCSLRHRGEELLAQNAGVAAYAERGKTMGIPLLYPWANRLGDFQYRLAGRSVQVPHDQSRVALDGNGLPIHGVIPGRLAWELTAEPDADSQALRARLRWSDAQPELFEVFPFRHDLYFDARLDGGRLAIELTVDACGPDTVPLTFGFHPYLSLPGASRETWVIELPAMRHLKLDSRQIPVGGGEPVGARRFELAALEFDDGFDALASPARFAATAARRRIEVEFLQGYPCAQVFAPLDGSFICFEPMVAPANALGSGIGLQLLDPGKRYHACFSITVQELRSGR